MTVYIYSLPAITLAQVAEGVLTRHAAADGHQGAVLRMDQALLRERIEYQSNEGEQ